MAIRNSGVVMSRGGCDDGYLHVLSLSFLCSSANVTAGD
jgi:hypothetical protein